MKQLEVRVPHSLSREEVRRRLDHAAARAQSEFGDRVGPIDIAWRSDDLLDVGLNVMGMAIESEVQLLPDELVVRLAVPGMAALFAGRIRAGIEERLGGLLASQPA